VNSDSFIQLLTRHQDSFHPVIPFNAEKEKLVHLDLSKANRSLGEEIYRDTGLFTNYVNSALINAEAKFAIGGYNELRNVYAGSAVFDAEAGKMPRRLHIGVDIWGKPYTPVISPIDGLVHSTGMNDSPGDYGATIILTHQLENITFYTLYGHLSRNSIVNKTEAMKIEKGEIFAEFGIPSENGQWPPHLHFQLIRDIRNYSGDYPGVCAENESAGWLNNSPDPDLILQLNRYARQVIF
jgi:peptidoglycan LD-endopeptidase LytH